MSARLLAVLLCLALAVPAVARADATIAVRGEYWFMDLSGDVAVSGDAVGDATDLSLDDSTDGLGLDGDNTVGFSAMLNLGPFFLFGRYIPIDVSGSGTTTTTVNFGDFTFDADATLDSSLEFDMIDAGLGIHVINFDDLPVRVQLGLLAEVKYLDGTVKATGDVTSGGVTTTESDSQDFTLPIPMVGARLNLGLADFLAVNVQGAAIAYSGDHLYDVEGRVELSPLPFVGISGGYRYLNVTVDESDVNIDATFDGPFIEAFVRF
jgi:outer membrane protein